MQPADQRPAAAALAGAADAPLAGLAALSIHTPNRGGTAGDAPLALPPPLADSPGAAYAPCAAGKDSFVTVPVPGGGTPAPHAQPRSAAAADGGTAAGGTADGGAAADGTADGGAVPTTSWIEAWRPFSPPATEQHAAFLALMVTKTKASLHERHARAADFTGRAAFKAAALFGADSLISVKLRIDSACELNNQAVEEEATRDVSALYRGAWALLMSALPVLQGRMDEGTLLPDKLRAVEEVYFVYEQQLICQVTAQPPPDPAALAWPAATFGYSAALCAAWLALRLLPLQPWPAEQRSRAQAYVLSALGLIPHTAGVLHRVAGEDALVDCLESGRVSAKQHGREFYAALQKRWVRRAAVASVLRARGALQGGGGGGAAAAAAAAATVAEFHARQRADVAKHGLRRCALPGCGRQEATVLQFPVCSRCRAARYCCPEHAEAHAEAHRPECAGRE